MLTSMVVLPFEIRRLGAPVYGAWVSIASFLVIGVLADAGVRSEIIRRVAAAHGAGDPEALTRAVQEGVTLLFAVGAAFLMFGTFGASIIRTFAFPNGVPGYSPTAIDWFIRATLLLLMASLVTNGYYGVLKGVQRGDVETTAQMLFSPVGAAIAVLGIVLGWGLWALLLGTASQLLLTSAFQSARLGRLVPGLNFRLVRMSTSRTRAYLALSGLVLVGQLSDVVDSQWDKLVLSHFVGSSAVTAFQVGTNLVIQARMLVAVPLVPLLAAMAELRWRDPDKMRRSFDLLSRTGMVLAAVILGGIFVFAPSFVRLWLGSEVAAAGDAARIFVIAAALAVVMLPLAYRALAEDWHRLIAVAAIVNMVVNGTSSLALTLIIGFRGPLYGSIAGNLAGTSLFLILIRRRLGRNWVRPPLKALVIGVAACASAIALRVDAVTTWPRLVGMVAVWVLIVGLAGTLAERLPVLSLIRAEGPT
jgi:O-antigen/teichoic acid export membrane protein